MDLQVVELTAFIAALIIIGQCFRKAGTERYCRRSA